MNFFGAIRFEMLLFVDSLALHFIAVPQLHQVSDFCRRHSAELAGGGQDQTKECQGNGLLHDDGRLAKKQKDSLSNHKLSF